VAAAGERKWVECYRFSVATHGFDAAKRLATEKQFDLNGGAKIYRSQTYADWQQKQASKRKRWEDSLPDALVQRGVSQEVAQRFADNSRQPWIRRRAATRSEQSARNIGQMLQRNAINAAGCSGACVTACAYCLHFAALSVMCTNNVSGA
jgi:hypothetical protein